MLEVVIALVIIALVLLFFRAGRQHTIVYRKRVAPPDRAYSVTDRPYASGPPESFTHNNDAQTGHGAHEALAFEGGEFGGGGAGDSYDSSAIDPFGYGTADFEAGDAVLNTDDFSGGDSGTNDSGNSDPGSDSSGTDSSNTSCD